MDMITIFAACRACGLFISL